MTQLNLAAASDEAQAVLRLLRRHHNVLVTGCPATGKSRLLAEVRYWFRGSGVPAFAPSGPHAFPANKQVPGASDWLPSPDRSERKTWEITFHQGTKYRDFVGGIMPSLAGGAASFATTYGPLYEAAKYSATKDGAGLVTVDEINRGPAVAIFGDTITAIESDKRLAPDGKTTPATSHFRILDPKGNWEAIALPHHLYLLAAMNEADTSVEPVDVAFRRRWEPFRLWPDESVLRKYFGLGAKVAAIPEKPSDVGTVLEVLVQAWSKINQRTALGRGDEFQLGHGILVEAEASDLPKTLEDALQYSSQMWRRIFAHLMEVFFGDKRGLAYAVGAKHEGTPYRLIETYFADTPVAQLSGPDPVAAEQVYSVLRAAAM